nr:hypothetical protein Itr_chr04CG06290 [Ipomoea trifida]
MPTHGYHHLNTKPITTYQPFMPCHNTSSIASSFSLHSKFNFII